MTHSGGKPHEVGDRGQRYEIRIIGYPNDGNNVLGWTNGEVQAYRMMSAMLKAPGCTSATIYDRQEKRNVITMYDGIQR